MNRASVSLASEAPHTATSGERRRCATSTRALLGGVLIGVSEALAGLFITPSAKSMFSFGLLILVLLLRPQGLLGRRT